MTKINYQTTNVKSSLIKAVSYNPQAKTLTLLFNTDVQYEYQQVEEETYVDMVTAESIGKYFHKHINHLYDYEQIAA
jgi:hypothetical protein